MLVLITKRLASGNQYGELSLIDGFSEYKGIIRSLEVEGGSSYFPLLLNWEGTLDPVNNGVSNDEGTFLMRINQVEKYELQKS